MPEVNLMRLEPASEEAKLHGCTCFQKKEDPESYWIVETCPIHWPINLVKKTGDMHSHIEKMEKYMIAKDKIHSTLFRILIALSGVMCALLIFKT